MDRELFNKKFNQAATPDQAMFLIKVQNDHLLALMDALSERVGEIEKRFSATPESEPVVKEEVSSEAIDDEGVKKEEEVPVDENAVKVDEVE